MHQPRVVVIGGGHNGLVCAAYLARAGLDTTLVEKRFSLGGVVGSYEYMPGYRSAITNSPGSFEGRITRELGLLDYGLQFHAPEITVAQRFRERTFLGYRDRSKIAEQIDSYAVGEYERYRSLIDRLNALGAAMRLSVWREPDSIEEIKDRLRGEQRDFFEQVIDGSLMDLLDTNLESPEAKSLLMMLALPGTRQSPREAGSALGLMLRPISLASLLVGEDAGAASMPLRGSVGTPIGSMSAIVDAIAASAQGAGARIVLGNGVSTIEKTDVGVSAVILEDGQRIPADAVISTIEPSVLQSELLPERDDLVHDHSVPAPRGAGFKLALALDGIPSVPGIPAEVTSADVLGSQLRIAPSPEYIESAIDDSLTGKPSRMPIMWGMVPSIVSPTLAPEGRHLFSVNIWHAPYELGEAYWQANRDAFAQRCIDVLDEDLPGLKSRVIDMRALSPIDLEREFSLTGADITHGPMTLENFFSRRTHPKLSKHRAALPGLYLGGSGSWPGGYVTGAPGRNAAQAVIEDLSSVSPES